MAHINYFPEEEYWCADCEDEYEHEDIKVDWCCPTCNQSIHIHARETIDENEGTFIRKQAYQIAIDDYVRPDHMSIDECYYVIGIKKLTDKKNNGKLGIGLKGYTRINVEPSKWISCRIDQ
ncbi:TPA: hypothetical protein RVR74_001288 [Aeromonas salmonicida]|nr:hypothetical protein [Aeromonas salmonicida]